MASLARYDSFAQDVQGNVIPGPTVEVRRESDSGLQPLYSDRAGTLPIGNPFTGAGDGLIGFYCSGGAYKITITKGSFSRSFRYVAIGTYAELDIGSNININNGGQILWNTNEVILTHLPRRLNLDFSAGGVALFQWQSFDGGAAGPTLVTYHNSPTPAAADAISDLSFYGNNASLAPTLYGRIQMLIASTTAGAEASTMQFLHRQAGANIFMNFNGQALYPAVNGQIVLGVTTAAWASLALIAGGSITFGNTNYTIIEASKTLRFDVTTTGSMFELRNNDAGATGVWMDTYHNSGSPAVNDVLFTLRVRGNDSVPSVQDYGVLELLAANVTNTTEAATWRMHAVLNGAMTLHIMLGNNALFPPDSQVALGGGTGGRWLSIWNAGFNSGLTGQTKTGTSGSVGANDHTIIMNASGTYTLTLPTASSYTGRLLFIKTIAAQLTNSAASNVIPLGGGAAAAAILSANVGRWAILQSNGTNWEIIAGVI